MKKYEIISFEEARLILQKERLHIKYQIPENFAIVYETKEKRVLLFPAKGNKVVMFPNEVIMQEIIMKEGVPIPSDNIFVRNSHIVADWEDNISSLLQSLSISIGIDLVPKIDFMQLDTISKAINKKIREMKENDIYELYYLPLGALLGKIISDNVKNAKWVFSKYYDINPYFMPDMEVDGRKFSIFKPILDQIKRKRIRLNSCLNRLSIKIKVTD